MLVPPAFGTFFRVLCLHLHSRGCLCCFSVCAHVYVCVLVLVYLCLFLCVFLCLFFFLFFSFLLCVCVRELEQVWLSI